MVHRHFIKILVCLSAGGLLSSCQNRTAQRFLKAKPAAVSPFLSQRSYMTKMRPRMPVHYMWINPDAKAREAVGKCTEIYVAPVDLRYLRPVSKRLVKWEIANGWVTPQNDHIANELRVKFMNALAASQSPRFRLVSSPGPRTVTLAMAITELNPTSTKGNAVKLAAKFFVGPLSGVLGVFIKGNIAIEGKVLLPGKSENSFMQFSDNEKDKMTFYSIRDFRPYGHALKAIDEWAAQFEEFARTSSSHRVKESSFITLKPW